MFRYLNPDAYINPDALLVLAMVVAAEGDPRSTRPTAGLARALAGVHRRGHGAMLRPDTMTTRAVAVCGERSVGKGVGYGRGTDV